MNVQVGEDTLRLLDHITTSSFIYPHSHHQLVASGDGDAASTAAWRADSEADTTSPDLLLQRLFDELIYYISDQVSRRIFSGITRNVNRWPPFFSVSVLSSFSLLFFLFSSVCPIFSPSLSDFERHQTSKIRGFIDFCDFWLQRTLQE